MASSFRSKLKIKIRFRRLLATMIIYQMKITKRSITRKNLKFNRILKGPLVICWSLELRFKEMLSIM
jgi:hypothetical protein